jgi:carbonic anhydrase
MNPLAHLLEKNRAWAQTMKLQVPHFFDRLAKQQSPKYLWIGCSDSRVPANQILGLVAGEVFVHRNVGNVAVHTDLNLLSVVQYAVDVLKIQHIIVCGHYGCGGVRAALAGGSLGLIDNWLRHIQDVAEKNQAALAGLAGEQLENRMCELNVLEQAKNIERTSIFQEAHKRGQALSIHPWIYAIEDGLIRDLRENDHDRPTPSKA